MYRITEMSGTVYAKAIDSVEDDLENIEIFIDESTPVLLCHDLDQAANMLEMDVEDIEVVG